MKTRRKIRDFVLRNLAPAKAVAFSFGKQGGFNMKKKFKMVNLDCANCAAKMEEAIKKIDGVTDATMSFMAQKLTIEADEERFDEIMQQAAAACARVDADCKIEM